MKRRLRHVLASMLAGAVLAGCGGGMEDLEQRVAEVKARKSGQIEPIPPIKQAEAFEYVAGVRRDPFQRAEPEPGAASGPRPDLDRPREPLEEFPLDALRMQGVIEAAGVVYALVKAPDGVIHRVAVGQHMGQNYGQIKAIDESEITLAELVADGFGGWVSRPATLALAE